jgi:streptogramin lyase
VYVSGIVVDEFSPSGVKLLTIATPTEPGGLAIGSDGSIYVVSSSGGVDKYSASGQALGKFTTLGGDFIKFDAEGNLFVSYFPTADIYRISPTGVGEIFASLSGAEGTAFDRDGNVYVSSYVLNVIEEFSPSGVDLGVFASAGLLQPYGLVFDADGNLYVANWGEGTVRKVSSSGEDLGVFASGLNRPRDIAIVPGPTTRDQCKEGGWETFKFTRNTGK